MRMRALAAAVTVTGALVLTTTGAAGATSPSPSSPPSAFSPVKDVFTVRCEGGVGKATVSVRRLTGGDPRRTRLEKSLVLSPEKDGPVKDVVVAEEEAGRSSARPSAAGAGPEEVLPADPATPPGVPSADGPAEAGGEALSEILPKAPSEVLPEALPEAPSEVLPKAPSEGPSAALSESGRLESVEITPDGPLPRDAAVSCAKADLPPDGVPAR